MKDILKEITPKPWKRDGWKVRGADNSVIAMTIPWDDSGCRKEDNANIELLTNAPDLYELVTWALDNYPNSPGPAWKMCADSTIKRIKEMSL